MPDRDRYRLPQPWRCPSWSSGRRCDLPRFHFGLHAWRHGVTTCSWGRDADKRQTYETDAPWVTWLWLSSDRETRITGRSRMRLTCAICGKREIVKIKIPRIGKVPAPPNGIHPERIQAIQRHAHPDRGAPMSWALPLLNPAIGIDLDGLAMRLEADMRDDDR